ncbi:hypothetical protein [Aeropyrum camini]|uniref:Uncharacterized protein n=1 Tax=Aeropyrum camini SY1 = JCM 12091 TaxID=1198449 RepID=U3TG41_9CREN|nr:hypothetical protein [Aeropyrum camini]BAN90284.1 hypothetical protein ACAM_0815 [Aeropyrum camini SY1 = JCM 12091]
MPARIVGKPEYLPDPVWEAVVRLHGAVDPETGHLICHHYPIALQLVETSEGAVPAVMVGDCILVVVGSTYVSRLLTEARESRLEELGADQARVGGVRVPAEAIAHVLSSLRDWRAQARFYTITLERGEHSEDAVIAVFTGGGEEWAAVLTECGRGGEERKSDTFYL